ncbi:uncharacterized protein LOC120331609 [Styela clava]
MMIGQTSKYAVFFSIFMGSLKLSNSQCSNSTLVINDGSGTIKSPNFENEYGISANCSWVFLQPSDGKTYRLDFTIVYQRLYFVINSVKVCSGSYELIINNVTEKCDRYLNTERGSWISKSFFDSGTCVPFDVPQKSGSLSDSVLVQYVSDGRKHIVEGSTTNFGSNMGFQIDYKYVECVEKTTTAKAPTATLSDGETTTVVFPNTEAKTQHHSTIISEGSSYTHHPNDDIYDIEKLNTTTSVVSGETNANGISDTAKLFLVSIPGFIGIILLVATAIVFCRKRGDKPQDGKNVEQENVGGNKMENAESPIQEPDHDTASVERDEPTTSAIQDEETPYTFMYSALARKDNEGDKKETLSAIEDDEHKYDMYSAVVRKTEGGDKETMHV